MLEHFQIKHNKENERNIQRIRTKYEKKFPGLRIYKEVSGESPISERTVSANDFYNVDGLKIDIGEGRILSYPTNMTVIMDINEKEFKVDMEEMIAKGRMEIRKENERKEDRENEADATETEKVKETLEEAKEQMFYDQERHVIDMGKKHKFIKI